MDTVCVTWNKELQTWEDDDGCFRVEVTSVHSVCSCLHLSVFTLLLNTSDANVEQVSDNNVVLVETVLFYQLYLMSIPVSCRELNFSPSLRRLPWCTM